MSKKQGGSSKTNEKGRVQFRVFNQHMIVQNTHIIFNVQVLSLYVFFDLRPKSLPDILGALLQRYLQERQV